MLFNDVPDFRDGNQQIKKREAPEAWTKNLNKLRQKDRDARWTKKSKMNFYGYKNHIKVDHGTKLIGTYAVSDAGQKLYAESAYIGQDESIEWCGMQAEVHEKGSSTCKPTDKQKASNHNKSKPEGMSTTMHDKVIFFHKTFFYSKTRSSGGYSDAR